MRLFAQDKLSLYLACFRLSTSYSHDARDDVLRVPKGI